MPIKARAKWRTNGDPVVVEIEALPGETPQELAERLFRAVTEKIAQGFPPDEP